MNNRFIGMALIGAGAILIVAIIYFVFFYEFGSITQIAKEPTAGQREATVNYENTNNNTNGSVNTNVGNDNNMTNVNAGIVNNNIVPRAAVDLEDMASRFSERFGSYSNHSDYSNIEDLKYIMSDKMQVWADDFLAEMKSKEYSDIYYGITTKAISTEIKSFDDDTGKAVVVVNTLRRESTGTMNNSKTEEKDLEMVFIKEDGTWKVDSAIWL